MKIPPLLLAIAFPALPTLAQAQSVVPDGTYSVSESWSNSAIIFNPTASAGSELFRVQLK